jgi:hypothetical protein
MGGRCRRVRWRLARFAPHTAFVVTRRRRRNSTVAGGSGTPPSISASERLHRPPPYLPIPACLLLLWYLSPTHLTLCLFHGRFRRCSRAPATTSRAPATFIRAGLCRRSPRSAVTIYLIPVMCCYMMLCADAQNKIEGVLVPYIVVRGV